MGSVRMFRDRVVSMEQTQEIGEKHLELLTSLVEEALPGFALAEHGLEHERDHYFLSMTNAQSGRTCRVFFTRMFLSDANRLPAVVADANAGVRAQIVACIREQEAHADILVTVARLLTEEERAEREEVEAEWRRKNDALLAAKRAEDERRARERQRQKQQDDARRQTQRERERRDKPAGGRGSQPVPAASPDGARPSRRRRRGRGGSQAPGASVPAPQSAGGNGPRQASPSPSPSPRPQAARGHARPAPAAEGVRGDANAPGADASNGASAAGGAGRRRRRRGRGRGGPRPAGSPASSGGASGS